jgi:hypothetical protein
MPLHHDDHAEHFVYRATESRGDFANRKAWRSGGEQFDDLDAFLESRSRVVAFAG